MVTITVQPSLFIQHVAVTTNNMQSFYQLHTTLYTLYEYHAGIYSVFYCVINNLRVSLC